MKGTIVSDLRFAVRALLRSWTFTLAAVLALMLGIGANTAIFSALHGILLSPLPFASPDRLVMIWTTPEGQTEKESVVGRDFVDWRKSTKSFEQIAGFFPFVSFDLASGDRAEKLTAASVTGNFFETLGVKALRGRVFNSREGQETLGHVAVISHSLAQKVFAGAGPAVGKTLSLSGEPFTVIGVMPPAFEFPAHVDLWIQASADLPQLSLDTTYQGLLGMRYLRAFGRLKDGVSLQAARSEMTAMGQWLARERPDKNAGRTIYLLPLREDLVGDLRPALFVLMSMATLVFLIACVNAASLLLARAVSREREIAVRISLGAGRNDLIRQLLAESLLLCLIAGALGVLLARGLLMFLLRSNVGELPRLQEVGINGPVLLFALGVTLVAGLLFGMLPVLQVLRSDLGSLLRESSNQMAESVRRDRLRNLLHVAELALAVILLVGTGLLLRSFLHLQQVQVGFNPRRLLVFQVSLDGKRYPEKFQKASFFYELLSRLDRLPNVESSAAALHLPYPGDFVGGPLFIEGKASPDGKERRDEMRQVVSASYFKTMSIPVIRGRVFTKSDTASSPQVAVISQAIADRYFPNEDPLGHRISRRDPSRTDHGGPEWFQIVGVVGNVRHFGPREEPQAEVYFPYTQWTWQFMDLVVRTKGDPERILPQVNHIVRDLDPAQPVAKAGTMESRMADAVAQPRLTLLLVSLFGLLATVLAALGVYGLVSYSAAQRRNEVGLRMALGAQRREILTQVILQGLRPTLIGIALGLAGSLALRGLIASVLFDVSPADPAIYLLVTVGAVVIATLAMIVPAYRTSRVEPLKALRLG